MKAGSSGGATDRAMLGLMASRRFQDLSPSAKSIRVLRSDEFGLTIYANLRDTDEAGLRVHRGRYLVAYEGEIAPNVQVQQVILETDHAHRIYQFLDLVESHVDRIRHELRLLAAGCGHSGENPLAECNQTDIDAVSGFDSPEVQAAIESALAQLGCRPLDADAYLGFQNVVLSKLDEWLARETRYP